MDHDGETSLIQKWRDHWNTRDKILNPSPQAANRMGVWFFWLATGSALFTAVYVVIPQCGDHIIFGFAFDYWLKLLACFVLFEVFINWNLCAMKDMSQVTDKKLKAALEQRESTSLHGARDGKAVPDGFESCPVCQLSTPPRSHHCPVCNTCILKRDHHCYFTGSCIGFYNQRYFAVLTMYVAIGSAYTILLITWYISADLTPDSVGGPLRYLPPFAIWNVVFGTLPAASFLMLLQMYVLLATFGVSGMFFCWQMALVFHGQTSYEASRDITRYQLGDVGMHIRSVFGPYWMFNFIYPLRTLPEGNGFFWKTEKATKGN